MKMRKYSSKMRWRDTVLGYHWSRYTRVSDSRGSRPKLNLIILQFDDIRFDNLIKFRILLKTIENTEFIDWKNNVVLNAYCEPTQQPAFLNNKSTIHKTECLLVRNSTNLYIVNNSVANVSIFFVLKKTIAFTKSLLELIAVTEKAMSNW